MLTYNLQNKSNEPMYIILYKNIKQDILDSKITDKLPSKRSLAMHLKISVMTVQNAYAQLCLEGYIYSIEKRGYFVAKDILKQNITLKTSKPEIKREKESMINLCDNNIAIQKFPFSIWTKQMRKTLNEDRFVLLKRMDNKGVAELRNAISQYLYRFRGLKIDSKQIIIGAGTEYLYSLVIKLIGRDKIYAIEDPGYKNIDNIYKKESVKIKYIPIDKDGMNVDALIESASNIAHILPSHHFPTGFVMPILRRQKVLDWANMGNYIIEDDYDSEFRFSSKPLPTLYSLDKNQRVIYINTFSKTISPSIRISYMILPKQLIEKFDKELSFYACTVSSFEQYTLAKFINDGYFERHINRMRKAYKQHRDDIIKTIIDSNIKATINEERSGLHFILDINSKYSDEEIKKRANEMGIKISFISDYCFFSKYKKGAMIINYSGISIKEFKKAIDILQKII